MLAEPLGFKIGDTPFDKINMIKTSSEGISCSTGDNFVDKNPKIYSELVDMEAYALAKVCHNYDIPFIPFKYITDGADEQAHEDWESNLADGIVEFKKKVLDNLQ